MASLAQPRMLSREEEATGEVEVRHEDQLKINKFSRLTRQQKRLEESLREKEKLLEDLEEVTTELELADEDEKVMYRVGEAFVNLALEQAQARLEAETERTRAEIGVLEESAEALGEEMNGLKAELYARFGRNINLDE